MDEATIKRIKQRDTDFMVGCGDGLWLRVRTTGRKTFIVRRKQAGKTRIITLGDWPVLSLKGAKAKTATAKTPTDATVNDLLEQYHEAVISRHARPEPFKVSNTAVQAWIRRKQNSASPHGRSTICSAPSPPWRWKTAYSRTSLRSA